MNPLKIALAIPTYNRLEKLKFALTTIEVQEITTPGVELYCVISNSCSTDGTTEFLAGLKGVNVKYILWNQPEYVNGEVKYVDIFANFSRCISLLPSDIDWVWLLGDDDYLTGTSVIEGLVKVLTTHGTPNTGLLHLCQARRSCKTNNVLKGTLFDLCNRIGFHEMLGWISSIVVRRDRACQAFSGDFYKASKSAYAHSSALLEACHADEAVFVDSDWVEPQDEEQTAASKARWVRDHILERYFYIVDDLLALYAKGTLVNKCNPIFFRYATYSLWDHYAHNLMTAAVIDGGVNETTVQHWNRVAKMADMLADPADQKMFRAWISSLLTEVNRLTQAQNEVAASNKRLADEVAACKKCLANLGARQWLKDYPSSIMNTSGTSFPI